MIWQYYCRGSEENASFPVAVTHRHLWYSGAKTTTVFQMRISVKLYADLISSHTPTTIALDINSSTLEVVSSLKLLGVSLQDNLNGMSKSIAWSPTLPEDFISWLTSDKWPLCSHRACLEESSLDHHIPNSNYKVFTSQQQCYL